MTEHIALITDQSGLELIGIGGNAEGGDMDEPVTVPERLRELSEAATPGPWTVGPGSWDELIAFYAESLWIGLATTGSNGDWTGPNPIGLERARANAALIVAAVNFVRSIPPGYVLVPGDSLDAAWRAAESALPEGWAIEELSTWDGWDGGWRAWAGSKLPDEAGIEAFGPTPAAALQALATLLQERKAGQ